MSIATFATIAFFLVFGVSYFVPFSYSAPILAIIAIIAGVALLIGR